MGPTADTEYPSYGALDLLHDPHGGSPRFGSSYVILRPDVGERTTYCVGDSHVGPRDIGTSLEFSCIVAGLAEQAKSGSLLGRDLGPADLVTVLEGDMIVERPARVLDAYVEAQIHGGVDLARDVEAIVLDPSFRRTSIERDLLHASSRFYFELRWHDGSELAVGDVPSDFRGPKMPELSRRVARPDGIIDAHSLGQVARSITPGPPLVGGDSADSDIQQVKYLWHTLLVFGRDASPSSRAVNS